MSTAQTLPDPTTLLDIRQTAERYQVSRSWLYKRVERRELGAYRIGQRIMFDPAELDAELLAATRIEPER